MTQYTVRAAGRDDIALLARNRIRMFEDMATAAGSAFDPTYLVELEAASVAVFEDGFDVVHSGWLAELDGQPVASAMVTLQPWLPHPRYPEGLRPYLHSVYIDPAHRGHRLARRLTEASLDWASAHGYSTMTLHASPQGRPVYEGLGFELSSEYFLKLA